MRSFVQINDNYVHHDTLNCKVTVVCVCVCGGGGGGVTLIFARRHLRSVYIHQDVFLKILGSISQKDLAQT